jgi:phasin family protein
MFLDMAKQFKMPAPDMNALMDAHRQNFEAMKQSVAALSAGTTAIAAKQQEIMASVVQEVQAMVTNFKPSGSPQEVAAKQNELARAAFNAAVENFKESAGVIQKSSAEASEIIMNRVKEAVAAARGKLETK